MNQGSLRCLGTRFAFFFGKKYSKVSQSSHQTKRLSLNNIQTSSWKKIPFLFWKKKYIQCFTRKLASFPNSREAGVGSNHTIIIIKIKALKTLILAKLLYYWKHWRGFFDPGWRSCRCRLCRVVLMEDLLFPFFVFWAVVCLSKHSSELILDSLRTVAFLLEPFKPNSCPIRQPMKPAMNLVEGPPISDPIINRPQTPLRAAKRRRRFFVLYIQEPRQSQSHQIRYKHPLPFNLLFTLTLSRPNIKP